MKVYISSSQSLVRDIELARMFEVDLVLCDKPGEITAAYVLTKAGKELMAQTGIRMHISEAIGIRFFPIPFEVNGASEFLEKRFNIEYVTDTPEQRLMHQYQCRKIRKGVFVSRKVYVISFSKASKLVGQGYYQALKPFVSHRKWVYEPHPDWGDNADLIFRLVGSTPEMVGAVVESKAIVAYTLDRWCKPEYDPEMIELRLPNWVLVESDERNYEEL